MQFKLNITKCIELHRETDSLFQQCQKRSKYLKHKLLLPELSHFLFINYPLLICFVEIENV
jgi:hypothetical protein